MERPEEGTHPGKEGRQAQSKYCAVSYREHLQLGQTSVFTASRKIHLQLSPQGDL